jgi:D-arabinose 1-dehydrogenase-like Zn-dependent alcohol dehydrogenase
MRLGHEWVGTVIETGREVKKFKPGDRVSVLSLQRFAEYSVAEENMTFALADDIKLEDGIGEPLKCIITVVRATAPEAGDHGVVLGCGPMGLWCLQAMSGHLTASLTAVDVDENKLKIARKFGAAHTINPKNEDILAHIFCRKSEEKDISLVPLTVTSGSRTERYEKIEHLALRAKHSILSNDPKFDTNSRLPLLSCRSMGYRVRVRVTKKITWFIRAPQRMPEQPYILIRIRQVCSDIIY